MNKRSTLDIGRLPTVFQTTVFLSLCRALLRRLVFSDLGVAAGNHLRNAQALRSLHVHA
jgi:hypothetical protein